MDHEGAVREFAAERYLLGELTGTARDAFEAHLFECEQCAEDLTASVRMAEAMRTELAALPPQTAPAPSRLEALRQWFSPLWLAPALATSLLLVAYQNTVQLPGLKQQLVRASAPEVLNTLVLAGGTARGDMPHINLSTETAFLLAVDVPPGADASSYTCTLYAPSGRAVLHVPVTAQQARDTVQLRIPTALVEPGEQTLAIEGGGRDVTKMRFTVDIRR